MTTKNTPQIVFGFVERAFKQRTGQCFGGYATVLVPGIDRQLSVSDETGPLSIIAGLTAPEFLRPPMKDLPLPSDELVMEVMHAAIGGMKVTRWGFAQSWREAENEISRRPLYRVLRENRFRGQIMKKEAQGEVFFEGSLEELVSLYPRDGHRVSCVDKLAPTYKTGPSTAKHRFEVRQDGAVWMPCDDPRPFPPGLIYRLTYWEHKGSLKQLAIGTALTINAKFPRDGKNDPLLAYRNDTTRGEGQGYLYWERYEERMVPEGERPWTEVGDPRPLYDEVSSTVLSVTAPASPKALPKSSKPRQFSMTVKSLEELGSGPEMVPITVVV